MNGWKNWFTALLTVLAISSLTFVAVADREEDLSLEREERREIRRMEREASQARRNTKVIEPSLLRENQALVSSVNRLTGDGLCSPGSVQYIPRLKAFVIGNDESVLNRTNVGLNPNVSLGVSQLNLDSLDSEHLGLCTSTVWPLGSTPVMTEKDEEEMDSIEPANYSNCAMINGKLKRIEVHVDQGDIVDGRLVLGAVRESSTKGRVLFASLDKLKSSQNLMSPKNSSSTGKRTKPLDQETRRSNYLSIYLSVVSDEVIDLETLWVRARSVAQSLSQSPKGYDDTSLDPGFRFVMEDFDPLYRKEIQEGHDFDCPKSLPSFGSPMPLPTEGGGGGLPGGGTGRSGAR